MVSVCTELLIHRTVGTQNVSLISKFCLHPSTYEGMILARTVTMKKYNKTVTIKELSYPHPQVNDYITRKSLTYCIFNWGLHDSFELSALPMVPS